METSEFLVIGSGIAGLNFALNAAEHGKVIVITKRKVIESNTTYAQGGVAAVLSKTDNFESHVADTLEAGRGLCNKDAVSFMVRNAPEQIHRLIELGVSFEQERMGGSEEKSQGGSEELWDESESGSEKGSVGAFDKELVKGLAMTKEGGHSHKRIVYSGDMTGRVIQEALIAKVKNHPNITLYEYSMGVDLILREGRCIGVTVLHMGSVLPFFAKSVVLATGSVGHVFSHTSNPIVATGDGVAMAYRAGAAIEDIEFIQFHPTTLDVDSDPHFLISETVRGEGGVLVNGSGEKFMSTYDPLADLAPRDVVARAIFEEQKKGQVYLDIRHHEKEFLQERFPTIFSRLLNVGVDMSKDLIPISPAVHYSCGGVKVDLSGRTNLPGLFAFGEVACTQVHGANRLASNSLLESLVFSHTALRACVEYNTSVDLQTVDLNLPQVILDDVSTQKSRVQDVMWRSVGIIRNSAGLKHALSELHDVGSSLASGSGVNVGLIELKNIVCVGKLIAQAALSREESRGTHYRSDFPHVGQDAVHSILKKS